MTELLDPAEIFIDEVELSYEVPAPKPLVFSEWPKIPRLKREAVITEKIDGTNAAVIIQRHHFGTHIDGVPDNARLVLLPEDVDSEDGLPQYEYIVGAQSRKRIITPDSDNFGFARFVYENADELIRTLGEGYHYGEWWGQGIQRRYDLDHKKFSLFNTGRWDRDEIRATKLGQADLLDVVPVLHRGDFSTEAISTQIERLRTFGSAAAPGFENAEGVVVYHSQSRSYYKVLLENDEVSKTEAGIA
jgi:hypothetical protein